jgi:hypothetical protein
VLERLSLLHPVVGIKLVLGDSQALPCGRGQHSKAAAFRMRQLDELHMPCTPAKRQRQRRRSSTAATAAATTATNICTSRRTQLATSCTKQEGYA